MKESGTLLSTFLAIISAFASVVDVHLARQSGPIADSMVFLQCFLECCT